MDTSHNFDYSYTYPSDLDMILATRDIAVRQVKEKDKRIDELVDRINKDTMLKVERDSARATCREKDTQIRELVDKLDTATLELEESADIIDRANARRIELINRCNKHYADENTLKAKLDQLEEVRYGLLDLVDDLRTEVYGLKHGDKSPMLVAIELQDKANAEARIEQLETEVIKAEVSNRLNAQERNELFDDITKLEELRRKEMFRADDAEEEAARSEKECLALLEERNSLQFSLDHCKLFNTKLIKRYTC